MGAEGEAGSAWRANIVCSLDNSIAGARRHRREALDALKSRSVMG